MLIRKFGYALLMCTASLGVAHATSVNVLLNTSALAADTSDQPFALEFDLENGTLSSNPVNSVSISNFNFGGGAAFPTTDLTTYFTEGGGSGDIASSVVLLGNSPRNLLSQGFTPGATLSFTINYTNNPTSAPALDTFAFGILDSSGTEIPTRGGRIFDAFIQIDFSSATPTILSFASDPTRATGGPLAPVGQGQFLTIEAAAIPEPATLGILASGLGFCVLRKRNRARLHNA